MPTIQCPCGKQFGVAEGRAGSGLTCDCGRQLLIPSLRVLRRYAARGEPAPATTPGVGTASRRQRSPELLFLLTDHSQLASRISLEALTHFIAACFRSAGRYFADRSDDRGFDIQMACALLPNGLMIVDVQARPEILSSETMAELSDRIAGLPRPAVVEGPVAFAARKMIAGGALREPEFVFPFADSFHRPGELDDLLMELGGLSVPDRRGVSRRRSALATWWSRVGSRLRGWLSRRLAKRQERQMTGGLRSHESPPVIPAIAQAMQSTSIEEVQSLLARHPAAALLYHRLGSLQLEQGQLEAAIASFSQFVQLAPDIAFAHASRGRAYCIAGDMQKGLADYTRAIEIDPHDAGSRAARGAIFLELAAWEQAEQDFTAAVAAAPLQPQLLVDRARARYARREIGGALEDLTAALRLDPYHEQARVLRGWTLLHRPNATVEDVDEAIGEFTCALEIEPNNPWYYAQRAEAYTVQNKSALAIEDCDRAIGIDANCGVAFGIRGYAHQQLENFAEAVTDCSRAIELGVELPVVYMSRAAGYAARGDVELAISDCDAAIALAPDYAVAYNYRGMLRLGQEEVDAAMQDFAEAIRLAPEWALPYGQRANALRMQSEYQQAIDQYTQHIELEPNNLTPYINRALTWIDLQQYEKAADDLNDVIRINDEFAPAYFHRAELLLRQSEFERALEDLNKAISLDPELAPAYYTRAQVYLHLKMNEQAVSDYSTLIRLYPTWPGAYVGRANAWMHMGDADKASADFREAVKLDPGSAEVISIQQLLIEARHLHEREDYEGAIAKATEVIEADERCAPAYASRAASYWYSEQCVEAADDYTHLIELEPETSQAYAGRGQVFAEIGEFEAALQDLDKAVEMERQGHSRIALAYALNGRGLANAGLAQYEEARRDFNESLQLCPANAWTHYNRGLMYHRLGDLAQAKASFERALELADPPLTRRKKERAAAFLSQFR